MGIVSLRGSAPRIGGCSNEEGSASRRLAPRRRLGVGRSRGRDGDEGRGDQAGRFSPVTRTIQTGDAIRWRNDDTVNHQVVADNGHFASPVLRPRQTYQRTFNTAGTFRYRDALEPAERGTIIVRGPAPSVSIALSQPTVFYGLVSASRGSSRPGRPTRTFPSGSGRSVRLVRQAGRPEDRHLRRVRLHGHTAAAQRLPGQVGERAKRNVTVGVRPRMTFIRRAPWFVTSAKAGSSLAGRWVYVQRRSSLGQWVNRKKVRLGSSGARRFKMDLPRGRHPADVHDDEPGRHRLPLEPQPHARRHQALGPKHSSGPAVCRRRP